MTAAPSEPRAPVFARHERPTEDKRDPRSWPTSATPEAAAARIMALAARVTTLEARVSKLEAELAGLRQPEKG